jgi:hypothetical protein
MRVSGCDRQEEIDFFYLFFLSKEKALVCLQLERRQPRQDESLPVIGECKFF